MKSKHNHPLFIIKQIIFMIKQMILPILAVFFANLRGREDWVIAVGVGLLFLILFIFAFLSWKNTVYYIENDVLFYQKGVLNKSKQGVGIDKITTINENQELIERIFGLSTFKVDAGSITKGNEIKLTISKKEAERLKEELEKGKISTYSQMEAPEKSDESKTEYHISSNELVLYAITSNSFFAGIVFLFAVWQFIEDIPFVESFIQGSAGSWVNEHFNSAVKGLSVHAIISAVLFVLFAYIFFSFLISTVYAVVKYYDFTVSRHGNQIEITHGLLEKKRYNLSADKITALYMKYGVIGQFCGIGELKIESIGYGDEKGEAAILYPVIKEDKRVGVLETLLPEYAFEVPVCKPPKRALKSFLIKYTSFPFLLAAILSFTVPYGAFSWIAVVLFFMAGFMSFKKTRISLREDQFVIMGGIMGKGITVIKSAHIQAINTRQSFFQKRSGLVHLEYSFQSNNFGKTAGAQFLDQNEVANMMDFR